MGQLIIVQVSAKSGGTNKSGVLSTHMWTLSLHWICRWTHHHLGLGLVRTTRCSMRPSTALARSPLTMGCYLSKSELHRILQFQRTLGSEKEDQHAPMTVHWVKTLKTNKKHLFCETSGQIKVYEKLKMSLLISWNNTRSCANTYKR